jgi:hypothetical protein
MPLRDILRGVATVADLTEEVLEPATALLPGPVRSSFRSALATFDGAGARAVTPRIDPADIAQASAFLHGSDTGLEAIETFVSVLAYAWQHAQSMGADQHLLFSETVAAASLAVIGKGDARASETRTAAILMALRRTNTASRLPGIPMTPTEDERAYVDRILMAACVWLLSERASGVVEEKRLLELALALVRARSDVALSGFADHRRLAEQLRSLADHL